MQAVAHAAVKHTYFVDILQKFSTESIQPIHQISQHIDNCVSTEHVQLVHQTLQFVQFTYIQFLRSIGNFSNGHHFSPYMRYVEIHWDTCLHCVCVTAASLYPLLNQNCIHASFTSRIGEGWLLIFTISGLIQRNI